MPEIGAQPYYAEPRLVALVPDGSGGWKLSITTSKGDVEQLPLTLKGLMRLGTQCTNAAHQILKDREAA